MRDMALVVVDSKTFSMQKKDSLSGARADKDCSVDIYGYKGVDLGGKKKGERDITLKTGVSANIQTKAKAVIVRKSKKAK